jgi:hypothetical protein
MGESREPTAHPTLIARLAELRQEAAGLLGDIDTRVKPKPDRIEEGKHLPGPVWTAADRWTIRVVDPDETPASVFANHPHCYDDDIVPLEPEESRRIGMAFLAAADWADKVRAREIANGEPDA